ncbi:membrane or secreted protein [Roseivirga echinicomitans]
MKSFKTLFAIALFGLNIPTESIISSEALNGAWETNFTNDDGREVHVVAILSGGYVSSAAHYTDDNSFLYTMGGAWKADGNTITQTYEFNTQNVEMVGESETYEYTIEGDILSFKGDDRVWKRIDNGTGGDLANAFLFTGRQQNGEIVARAITARKTMKILSGTRFQWIAYNVDTGDFSGTGGGTYTTINGKYTENIEFFSRDVNRVGASLQFDYKLVDKAWHHSGLSSTGNPIYEVWTPREIIEKK